VGPSVSARTARGGADPGVLAGHGGSRDGIGGSTEWPIRAACPPRANGSHHYDPRPFDGANHDARPFDRSRYDRDADEVSDLLSISGAYGVPCGFTVSFTLTRSIEGVEDVARSEGREQAPWAPRRGRVGVGYRTAASLASPPYSPECVEGVSLLKKSESS
jgi:hypothetical protein